MLKPVEMAIAIAATREDASETGDGEARERRARQEEESIGCANPPLGIAGEDSHRNQVHAEVIVRRGWVMVMVMDEGDE